MLAAVLCHGHWKPGAFFTLPSNPWPSCSTIPFTLSVIALLQHCFQCLNCWLKIFKTTSLTPQGCHKLKERPEKSWRQGSALWFPCRLRFSGPETAPPPDPHLFPGELWIWLSEEVSLPVSLWTYPKLGRPEEGSTRGCSWAAGLRTRRSIRILTLSLTTSATFTRSQKILTTTKVQRLDYLKCWLFTLSPVLIQVLSVSEGFSWGALWLVFSFSHLLLCTQWYPVCF